MAKRKVKKTNNQANEFSTTPKDHNEGYSRVAYIIDNFQPLALCTEKKHEGFDGNILASD